MTDDEQDDLHLAVPFTVVASAGGPYDDEAFAAGFQLGMIHMQLQVGRHLTAGRIMTQTLRRALVKQVDLIAMHHGYMPVVEDIADYPDWVYVSFEATG